VCLKCQPGVICRTVIHQPHRQCQRQQVTSDIDWNDLPAPSIKAPSPRGELRVCASHELNTRVVVPVQTLVEPMRWHRNKLSKHLILEHRQRFVISLVLHEQTRIPTVNRQTSIAQKRSCQYLLLLLRQTSILNFPRRCPHTFQFTD